MPEGAAVDASPLLYLGRIGRADLLRALDRRIVVPRPVLDELRAGDPHEPVVRFIEDNAWLEVISVPSVPPEIRAWELGACEAAVLSWVHERDGATAVLDDREARRCAATLGLSFVGTLAVTIAAKKRGRIQAVAPLIEDLRAHGMYLSEAIVREVLAVAGEVADG